MTNALRILQGPTTILDVIHAPLLLAAELTSVEGTLALRLNMANFPDNTAAIVEASSDLKTWYPVLALQPPVGNEPILLPIVSAVPARFYRVRESY